MNKKNIFLWILSVLIAVGLLYYQRITGPTYPKTGSTMFQGKEIDYTFLRTDEIDNVGPGVIIPVSDSEFKGVLLYKRHKTNDELTRVDMKLFKDTIIKSERALKKSQTQGFFLFAELPEQPAAGKYDYYVRLIKDNNEKQIPEEGPITVRYKGAVPMWIIIIHIIVIFLAFAFATKTFMEFFTNEHDYKKYIYWTHLLLILGGFVFGPLMQYYAFGEWWTGFPFGFDLTDNKMLIAYIGWIISTIMLYKSKKPGYWILGAWILMLIVFLIPHSLLGSELDYNAMK